MTCGKPFGLEVFHRRPQISPASRSMKSDAGPTEPIHRHDEDARDAHNLVSHSNFHLDLQLLSPSAYHASRFYLRNRLQLLTASQLSVAQIIQRFHYFSHCTARSPAYYRYPGHLRHCQPRSIFSQGKAKCPPVRRFPTSVIALLQPTSSSMPFFLAILLAIVAGGEEGRLHLRDHHGRYGTTVGWLRVELIAGQRGSSQGRNYSNRLFSHQAKLLAE